MKVNVSTNDLHRQNLEFDDIVTFETDRGELWLYNNANEVIACFARGEWEWIEVV